jgi:hypothetical protein
MVHTIHHRPTQMALQSSCDNHRRWHGTLTTTSYKDPPITRGSLNTPVERCTRQSGGQGQHRKSQSLGSPTLACPDPDIPDHGQTLAFLKVARSYNPY